MNTYNKSIKKNSISSIMLEVILALIPAILCMIYFYGISYIIIISNSVICAILSEYLFLKAKGYPNPSIVIKLKDLSAVVTAILLSLCMPPDIPWYILSFGTIFAIVIVKQLYGGLGQNIFNPAMVGYCVLLISFPALFASWPVTDNIKSFNLNFESSYSQRYDSISSATPLETIKSQTKNNQSITSIKESNPNIFSAWFVINLSYLLGGLYLILRKIIKPYPSLSFLISMGLLAAIFSSIWPEIYPNLLTTLFTGSTMIAAFFIVTDPVTMPASFINKIIYTAAIAALTYIIRTFAGYPDGVAFAVILMNATVPLLDKINIPKPFGVN